MKKFSDFMVHDKCGTPDCCGQCDTAVVEGSKNHTGDKTGEKWEDGYDRRVVKVTDSDQKEKGYTWRIKGKERDEITIKLYKNKPDFDEFKKQMRRVAGHEFGG